MKSGRAATWFLLGLTGLLCVGWVVLTIAILRRHGDMELLGACLLGVPALLFTLRDSVRDWKAARRR
jgi:hypothetical protein